MNNFLAGTGTDDKEDAGDLSPNGSPVYGDAKAGPSTKAQQKPNGDHKRTHGEQHGEEEGPELSLNDLPADGPPQANSPAAQTKPVAAPRVGTGEHTGPTPYDGVLNMLRNGPLARPSYGAPPPQFPAPRTKEEREADAAEKRAASAPLMQSNPMYGGEISSPVQGGFVFGSPVPGPAAGSGQRRPAFGQKRYTASRLGPFGGGGANAAGVRAPGSSLRPGTRPASGYAFSRFAPHPAAAAAAPNGGASGLGAGLAAAAAAAAAKQSGGSPAPLAWTPMRSTPGSAFRGSAGAKRKAENEPQSVAVSQPGSVSILDAQRRLRQRAESAAPASADRRSWRAGRTPYQSRSNGLGGAGGGGLLARSNFGAAAGTTPARPASASPAPDMGAFDGWTPIPPSTGGSGASTPGTGGTAGSKPTTDTARRILETLNELDQTIKGPSGDASPAPGPSPPPTDSLGGGLPKATTKPKGKTKAEGDGEGATVRAQKRRVTFAELTGTPAGSREKTAAAPSTSAVAAAETIDKAAEKPPLPVLGKPVEERKKKPDIAATPSSLPVFDFKAASKAPKSSEFKEEITPSAPLFKFAPSKPSELSGTTTAATTTAIAPLFSIPNGAAAAAEKGKQTSYTFGAKPKDAELNKKVKAVATGAGQATGSAPTFLFGKEKREAEKDVAKVPAPKVSLEYIIKFLHFWFYCFVWYYYTL